MSSTKISPNSLKIELPKIIKFNRHLEDITTSFSNGSVHLINGVNDTECILMNSILPRKNEGWNFIPGNWNFFDDWIQLFYYEIMFRIKLYLMLLVAEKKLCVLKLKWMLTSHYLSYEASYACHTKYEIKITLCLLSFASAAAIILVIISVLTYMFFWSFWYSVTSFFLGLTSRLYNTQCFRILYLVWWLFLGPISEWNLLVTVVLSWRINELTS